MMRKRKGLKAIWVITMFLLTTGVLWCGGQKDSSKAGTTTLTIWDFKYGDPKTAAVMDKIEAKFMEANPGIKIKHIGQPNDDYYNLLRAAVASGQGPDVAMFHGGAQSWEFDEFQVKLDGYIAPYRAEISESSWRRGARDENLSNGIKIAPLTMQGFGYYYNKTLFQKAGLDPAEAPRNWDDLLYACEKLKAAGITPITCGLNFIANFMLRSDLANIYGPEMGELASGEEDFSNPIFIRYMNMLMELKEREFFDPEGVGIPYWMDAIEMFKAGKGAIFSGLLSDIAHWKDFSDSNGKENIGYFPSINFSEAPFKNMQTIQPIGIGWGVMKWSKAKDAAAKFIEFYLTGEGAEIFASELGALHANINLDANAIGYPVLDHILMGMSDETIQADFVQLFPSSFESEMNRYLEMLFVTQEISVEEFADKLNELTRMQ